MTTDYSILGISWVEWVGYTASLLVLISLMMASILRLRILNLIGATVFCIYGLLIHSYPVAGMNFLIVLSNVYYLFKLRKVKEEFILMETSKNSTFLKRFIEINYKEIQSFFPNFVFKEEEHSISFYILRDTTVAGLFMANHYDDHTLKIVLDYVTPEYRDFKVGNYIHQQLVDYFTTKGYRRLLCESKNATHIKYLEKMGYQKQKLGEKDFYIKNL